MARHNTPRKNTHQVCVHHWLCGDEESAVVHAVCAKCGTETDFVQSVPSAKKYNSRFFFVRVPSSERTL